MERVASHLIQNSKSLSDSEMDVFVRSAFNRYYYATFLNAREMLREIEVKWARTPHVTYPDHLRGKMRKRLIQKANLLARTGNPSEASLIKTGAKNLSVLADIMEEAYSVRIVADYEPETLVLKATNGDHSLQNVKISDAKQWVSSAEGIRVRILRLWNDY